VLKQKNDAEGAAAQFRQADSLNKEKMNVQAATLTTNTGARQLREGDAQGALEKFRAASKLAPDYAPAHYQMGLALLKTGKIQEARAEFEKAHQLDPRLRAPHGSGGP